MAEGDTNWYDGLDDAGKGVLQAKGWDKLAPADAVGQIFTSYREAEKRLGIPADRVMRIPEDDAGWKEFRQKHLGVPADTSGYDLSKVRFGDGAELDEGFSNFVKTTALQLGIPSTAVGEFAAAMIRFGEDAEKAEAETDRISAAAAKATLQQQWAGNYETFDFIARRAAVQLGLKEDELNAIANQTSYGTLMSGLLKIGQAMGEARLLGAGDGSGGGGGNTALTKEQAAAKLESLKNDPSWVAKWRSGDADAVKDFANLTRLMVGQPAR